MSQIKWIAVVAAVFLISIVPTHAQTPGVNGRQINQQKRIKHGMKTGEITHGEFAALKHQQREIHKMKRRAKRDGHVGRYERARIHKAQNRSSRNVYRKKHNGWKR